MFNEVASCDEAEVSEIFKLKDDVSGDREGSRFEGGDCKDLNEVEVLEVNFGNNHHFSELLV